MVVRNVDQFLAESIESILTQTFRDFEFVIVDFGSTDSSKSIALSYAAKDNRIKFHEVPSCSHFHINCCHRTKATEKPKQ